MGVPFMRAYAELLVKTCHRRGAHAIGGMAAFIPSRRDPEVNAVALARVREDKEREAAQGYDGTWVAHPDLVPLAIAIFNLMEDAATSEIARSQVWQWLRLGKVSREQVRQAIDDEVATLGDGND